MDEKKSLDLLHSMGALILVIASIFGVIIPIAGFSYDQGYMSVLGLNANSFPRSLSDLWQQSFLMSLKWLAMLLKFLKSILVSYLVVFIILVILGTLLVTLRTLGKLSVSKKKYDALFKRVYRFTESIRMFYEESKSFLYALLIILFAPSLLYFLLAYPMAVGKQHAHKVLDTFKESGCVSEKMSNCVDYSNPGNPQARSYNGLLFAASSTHIAIFDGKNVNVIPRTPEYILTRTYKDGKDESNR